MAINQKAYQSLLDYGYSDDQIMQMREEGKSWKSAKEIISSYTPQNTSSNSYVNQGAGNYVYNPTTWYYENTSKSSSEPTMYNHHISYNENNKPISVTTTNLATGESVIKAIDSAASKIANAKNAVTSSYVNQWAGSYTYNPVSWYYEKVTNKGKDQDTIYNSKEDTNHYWVLYDKNKTDPNATYSWEWKVGATWDIGTTTPVANQTASVDLTGGDINQNMNKWGDFTAAVNNKLQTAFGMQDLNELKQKYPDQYNSLIQSLDAVAGTWNALDPSQRGLLEWQLQAILWTAVWAWSDMSKLNVLESSIMDKFRDPDRVKADAQNVIRLQTEGLTTGEIANQMRMSEDQVQQLILLANGLDSKAWEYYELTDKAAKDITEPYDTQIERLEQAKQIQLDRANRQIEWMKQDFDTQIDRQKKANDINAHNADFISGQYWFWFSKRGIEWLNYVQDQAQQIIDDMVKNYDRNNQEMVDWVTDILRNWEWNNEDLLKASEDALTQAKNAYTSNMLAIQQQYGTVWMQAQQQLAENVQNFITQAETIYDNALNRQQQNLTNLITNFSNLNALQYSNLTLRNAQIQQFQNESMDLNRNQLQGLAQQLGMDSASFQDLVNYQAQAVANSLNGYLPWAWVQFQSQIQNLLNSWYTPNQAISSIMNSQAFKDAQQTAAWSGENWSMNWGIMYNKATWEYIDLNWDEYWTIGDNLYNKRTGEIISGKAPNGSNYVTSQVIDWKEYWVTMKTIQWLQTFFSNHPTGSKWGQCGSFVNDYLQSLGLWRVFTDPIDKKVAAINTPKWYQPQVWDVVVMDSPNPKTKQYGHVAIITGINEDGTFSTLESNKKWEWEVFTRNAVDPKKVKVYWYYHPDGAWTVEWGSNVSNNYEWGYNPDLEFVFEQMAANDWKLDSTTQKNLIDKWYSLEDIGKQYNNYKSVRWTKWSSYTLPEWFVVSNPELFNQVSDKSKINNTIKAYSALKSTAEKLKALVLEYWTEIRPTKAKTNMQQYVRDIQLQAKELYNLWVLNWPDLELMESVIYNPTTKQAKWESFINWRSKQDIWDIMEEWINTVNEKAIIELENQWISTGSSVSSTGNGRWLTGTVNLQWYWRS